MQAPAHLSAPDESKCHEAARVRRPIAALVVPSGWSGGAVGCGAWARSPSRGGLAALGEPSVVVSLGRGGRAGWSGRHEARDPAN
jgi:hypothetical protein